MTAKALAMKYSVHEKRPIDFSPTVAVVACYVGYLDTYLFLKRSKGCSQPGTWGVPAGKLDDEEAPIRGMQRELEEETGIQLKQAHFQSLGDIFIRYPDVDFIYTMFHITLDDKPKLILSPREHSDYKWMSREEIGNSSLVKGASEAFEIYQSRLK